MLKEAFKKAGIEPVEDRLAHAVDAALGLHPDHFLAAVDHLFGLIATDAALVDHVFRGYAEAALRPLLRNRMAAQAVARGHVPGEAQRCHAARNHPASAGSRPGLYPPADLPKAAE